MKIRKEIQKGKNINNPKNRFFLVKLTSRQTFRCNNKKKYAQKKKKKKKDGKNELLAKGDKLVINNFCKKLSIFVLF
jgi:hypothetical protein